LLFITTRRRVGVVAPAVRGLLELRRKMALGLEHPVPAPLRLAAAQRAIVCVAKCDLEMAEVVVKRRGDGRVPLVELEGGTPVAVGGVDVDGEAGRGEPVVDPAVRRHMPPSDSRATVIAE